MLRIAVCDDESIFCEELEEYIKQYLEKENIQYQLHSYSRGEELLNEIENYDVVF